MSVLVRRDRPAAFEDNSDGFSAVKSRFRVFQLLLDKLPSSEEDLLRVYGLRLEWNIGLRVVVYK